jgi:metal-responsive CopG/Arc/MetJ family transcriptional regulator
MPSIRVLPLAALAAALIAAPTYFAFAQPGTDPKPAPPTTTPQSPAPADAPKPADGDHAPQPGTEGPRRGREGGPGGPGGPGGRPDQGGAPASVRQAMSMMNRALRTFRKQASDASKKDENLKLIADMQRGCLAAKSLIPERALNRAKDQTKKDELAITYRKQLISLMDKLLKIETAILDGKGEDARTLVDEIMALRDHSHELLGVKD